MDNVQQLTEHARNLERAGDLDAALEAYLRLAEQQGAHRDDPAFWLRLADLRARGGVTAEVREHYARGAEQCEQAGLHNAALAVWRRLLGIFPGDAAAHLAALRLAVDLGYLRDARESLDAFAARLEDSGRGDEAVAALQALRLPAPADGWVRDALRRLGVAPAAEPPRGAELPTLGSLDDGSDLGLDALTDLDGGAELPPLDAAEPVPNLDLGLEPTSLGAPEPRPDDGRFAPLEGLETAYGISEPDPGPPAAPPPPPAPPQPRDEPGAADELPLLGEDPPAPPARNPDLTDLRSLFPDEPER